MTPEQFGLDPDQEYARGGRVSYGPRRFPQLSINQRREESLRVIRWLSRDGGKEAFLEFEQSA